MTVAFSGKVQIINTRLNTGKILLDDGRSSRILTLPNTFETGDPITVRFEDNDPMRAPLGYEVRDATWNYGFIVSRTQHYGYLGRSYPKLGDLVSFAKSDFPLAFDSGMEKPHLQVRYRIIKAQDGRTRAFDIEEAPKEMSYRCGRPYFGQLELRNEPDMSSGIVKKVSREGNFGFIENSQDRGSVHFYASLFKEVYRRDPREGDPVYFRAIPAAQGPRVASFLHRSEGPWLFFVGEGFSILCPRESFVNFSDPEPEVVYYAYPDPSRKLVEIRKMDPSNLGEAIHCYNSRHLAIRCKLEAIQSLIDREYHSTRVTESDLREARASAVADLVAYYVRERRYADALAAEARYQMVSYDPARLRRIPTMDPKLPLCFEMLNHPPALEESERARPLETDETPLDFLPPLPYLEPPLPLELGPQASVFQPEFSSEQSRMWAIDLSPAREFPEIWEAAVYRFDQDETLLRATDRPSGT